MSAEKHKVWAGIVLGGVHRENGMVSYAGILTAEDSRAIQAFVIERAHAMLEAGSAARKP